MRPLWTDNIRWYRPAGWLCLVLWAALSWTQEHPKEQEYKLTLREYAGNYQVDSHRTFIVSLALRGELAYIDVSSDLSEELTQSKTDEFQAEDKTTLIRFVRDQRGVVRSLRLIPKNAAEVSAQRVSNLENEIAVSEQNAEIRGTLIVPPSADRVAALIIEGGSGWRFQEDMMNYARLAALHGFASFVWDRRGWGNSTGEKAASFEDLAEDVAAIAAKLRKSKISFTRSERTERARPRFNKHSICFTRSSSTRCSDPTGRSTTYFGKQSRKDHGSGFWMPRRKGPIRNLNSCD